MTTTISTSTTSLQHDDLDEVAVVQLLREGPSCGPRIKEIDERIAQLTRKRAQLVRELKKIQVLADAFSSESMDRLRVIDEEEPIYMDEMLGKLVKLPENRIKSASFKGISKNTYSSSSSTSATNTTSTAKSTTTLTRTSAEVATSSSQPSSSSQSELPPAPDISWLAEIPIRPSSTLTSASAAPQPSLRTSNPTTKSSSSDALESSVFLASPKQVKSSSFTQHANPIVSFTPISAGGSPSHSSTVALGNLHSPLHLALSGEDYDDVDLLPALPDPFHFGSPLQIQNSLSSRGSAKWGEDYPLDGWGGDCIPSLASNASSSSTPPSSTAVDRHGHHGDVQIPKRIRIQQFPIQLGGFTQLRNTRPIPPSLFNSSPRWFIQFLQTVNVEFASRLGFNFQYSHSHEARDSGILKASEVKALEGSQTFLEGVAQAWGLDPVKDIDMEDASDTCGCFRLGFKSSQTAGRPLRCVVCHLALNSHVYAQFPGKKLPLDKFHVACAWFASLVKRRMG